MPESFIIVKFDLEGYHNWPDAPDKYTVLRAKHGHVFHFEVQVSVSTFRQIEFLEARRTLMKAMIDAYGPEPCDFGSMSCENLAGELVSYVSNIYSRGAIARVYEDAFVGAEVRRL